MKTRLLILFLASFLFAGCSKQDHDHETLYTCGMHPQVIQKGPGNCPICGMKLTPVRNQSGTESKGGDEKAKRPKYYKSTMNPGETSQKPGNDSMGMAMVPVYEDESASTSISMDPMTIQNMGIRTELVKRGPLRRDIRTVGMIDYNETGLMDVTTKYKGWIETLYADATGQQVRKGEPLFEIYSPELWSAQSEYLLSLKQPSKQGKNPSLTRLKFLDVSDAQIAEIEKSGQPLKAVRINAPMDGIIIEKSVVAGQMVDAGMKLYRIADLSLVWVQAQVYEQDIPYLRLGQEAAVTLSYLTESKFRGRVTYIYPTVDEKTRTARVRMEFHNPGLLLKPGMFATVQLRAEMAASTLLVPSSAILRSGERNTVFIALGEGKFEPRTVVLGPRSENDNYQVLSGLKEGESVVTSGQFMLDSESQLREAIQKMQHPGAKPEEAAPEAPQQPSPPAAATSGTAYACPMPEHESILHKAPGKCPLCGMTLIPVPDLPPSPTPGPNTAKLESPSVTPASTSLYTCPMASDAHVVADKPGECPECGMALVETSKVKHGKIAEANWAKQHSAKAE